MWRARFNHRSLYPTGGALAGAAIGTVLLPGVGTGLGAKAGQAIENLFEPEGRQAGQEVNHGQLTREHSVQHYGGSAAFCRAL